MSPFLKENEMPKGIRKPVFGVGINDYPGTSSWTINGVRYKCPFYRKWVSMLARCYKEEYLAEFPTYAGCSVSEEWKYFTNFRVWMEEQDWVGKELDKDILVPDNKIYSKETCVFISRELNAFLNDHRSARGLYNLGVSWHKRTGMFVSQCSNPLTGKSEYLGLFDSEEAAHLAWKQKKHEHALVYAEQQTDPRVADALRTRYL